MKQSIFEIISNEALTKDVYKMVMAGDTSAITASGQFVNIQLTGNFLRRPISVCDYDEKTLTIVYKVVGAGTEQMSEMKAGTELDKLVGVRTRQIQRKLANVTSLTEGEAAHFESVVCRHGHLHFLVRRLSSGDHEKLIKLHSAHEFAGGEQMTAVNG